MIVAAAVCPGAPLLIAGVAPAVAARVPDLLAACDASIAVLAAADRLLVVAGPPGRTAGCTRTARLLEPGSAVVSRGFTRSDCGQPALRAPGPRCADTPAAVATPATAAGLVLLGRRGAGTPTWVLELGLGSGPTPLASAADEDRWGVLVLADGSACHGGDAPGRADQRAPRSTPASRPPSGPAIPRRCEPPSTIRDCPPTNCSRAAPPSTCSLRGPWRAARRGRRASTRGRRSAWATSPASWAWEIP